MFSSVLVCLLAVYTKSTRPICTKFGGKVAHGPQKKPLDFGSCCVRVRIGLQL